MPEISSWLESFLSHLDIECGLSQNTLQSYRYDLEQFMKDLNGDVVPAAFKAQLDKAVLHKGCLETARPSSYKVDAANYCGLGIYIPIASRSKWNDYFKTIDWYEVSGWSDVTFSWDF